MSTNNPFIVPICHEKVDILYQDDALLIVNKPTSLLSVPGKHPANQDCVITRIQRTHPSARIVHRLDMDTSGVMVLALTAETHRTLSKQFELREVKKHYEAIVFGTINKNGGSIDAPLCCDWPNRPKQKVDKQYGKIALTHYEVLYKITQPIKQTRLLLKPVTGRSHQLRVHLAYIGHPILGCDFYAHQQAFKQASRLLLHATYLKLTHPITGTIIEQLSPAPF